MAITTAHAAVGVTASSITGYLTTLLTGYHGLDADHASAAAAIITIVGGSITMVAAKVAQAKWPSIFGSEAQK